MGMGDVYTSCTSCWLEKLEGSPSKYQRKCSAATSAAIETHNLQSLVNLGNLPIQVVAELQIHLIALFTISFSHLCHNVIQRGSEAISGWNCKIARNCRAYMLNYIVMKMRKVSYEKGYGLGIVLRPSERRGKIRYSC